MNASHSTVVKPSDSLSKIKPEIDKQTKSDLMEITVIMRQKAVDEAKQEGKL